MKKRDLFIAVVVIVFGLLYQFFESGNIKILEGCKINNSILLEKNYPNVFKLKSITLKNINRFNISNIAGSINIKKNDIDETFIEINSTVYSKNKKTAEKIRGKILSSIKKKGSLVTVSTTDNSRFSYSRVRIAIIIKTPQAESIRIKNRYGNISIGIPSGETSIDEKYGDINIEDTVKNLNIKSKYSKVKVKRIQKKGDFNSKYSYFDISGSGSIKFKAAYSELFLNNLITEDGIILICSTSKLSLNKINASELILKNSNGKIYLDGIKVNTSKIISENCRINIDNMDCNDSVIKNSYGRVRINELHGDSVNILIKNLDMNLLLGEQLETVNISAKYCDIDLLLKKKISPFFDINSTYGEIFNKTSLSFLTTKEIHKIRLSGGGRTPKIIIFAKYSDIKLKNN